MCESESPRTSNTKRKPQARYALALRERTRIYARKYLSAQRKAILQNLQANPFARISEEEEWLEQGSRLNRQALVLRN